MGELAADVFGLDCRLPLDRARKQLFPSGAERAVQGNLDPCSLFAPVPEIERRIARVMEAAPRVGHIFNLGHGILPPTPVEHAQAAVEIVHRLGQKKAAQAVWASL